MTTLLGRQRTVSTTVCLLALASASPAAAWRQEYSSNVGSSFDRGDTLAVDAAGNVAAAGSFVEGSGSFIVKLDGATGGELWRQDSGLGVNAVAIAAADDVVAAGGVTNPGPNWDFAVMRFAAADGAELWRAEIDGPFAGSDFATVVTVDGADDVVAGGYLTLGEDTTPGPQISTVFTVAKFDGANGMELWSQQIGTDDFFNRALDVAVDAANDIVALGRTGEDSIESTVVKLAAGDGSVLWSVTLADTLSEDIALDGAGDVLVAAENVVDFFDRECLVLKLDGATGDELWRREIQAASCSRVTVDAANDIVVGGNVNNGVTETDWRIMKLDGATGADVWSRDVTGRPSEDGDRLTALAVDPAGDVVAGGYLGKPGDTRDLVVLKLAGADGSELWRQVLAGSSATLIDFNEDVAALGILPGNAVAMVGTILNAGTSYDFFVLSLGALDGAVGPVSGQRMAVGDAAGAPARRRITGVSRDPTIKTPPSGTAGDPVANGGSITLRNPTTLEAATFLLPAGSAWGALGSPPGSRGYKYSDPNGINGPCKLLLVKPGAFRAACVGSNGPIPFDLDEPAQGSLELSVRLGAAEPQCVRFGGTVRKDAGTASPGPRATFSASKAPAFSGDCP